MEVVNENLALRILPRHKTKLCRIGRMLRFMNVGWKTSRHSRAIANATLTIRSFEIQLKGVPSITGASDAGASAGRINKR